MKKGDLLVSALWLLVSLGGLIAAALLAIFGG
jgi:hypothetical protein